MVFPARREGDKGKTLASEELLISRKKKGNRKRTVRDCVRFADVYKRTECFVGG